jgi:hypothetical protein
MNRSGPLPWPGQNSLSRLAEFELRVERCDADLQSTREYIADLQAHGALALEEAAGRYLNPRDRAKFIDRLQAEDTYNTQLAASEKARQQLYRAQAEYNEDANPRPPRRSFDPDHPLGWTFQRD